VLTFRKLPWDPRTDFAPIAMTGTVQTCFVLAPGLAVKNFLNNIAWVKADRQRGSFGSTALGSSTHFFGLQLGDAFGIELEPVGYRGAAPLISDLAAGHITAGCGGVSNFLTHHKLGFGQLCGIAERMDDAVAEGGTEFCRFASAPGREETLLTPDVAPNRSERVSEGRPLLAVPSGR